MNVTEADLGIVNVEGLSSVQLGRTLEDNHIILPHPAVSAHHAQLELRTDGWWVHDLHSDHGTFINSRRVGPDGLPIRLERDTLWIAPFALRLSMSTALKIPQAAHMRLDLVNLQRTIGDKVLLDLEGTPLSFRPGEFISIVGGSGAGKSTLLKALLGVDTIQGKGRRGDVYFNNQLLIQGSDVRAFAPLNAIVGYVPQQDDSIHFQLSAREALDYTARLRFAADLSGAERIARIAAVLDAVQLDREELQTKPIAQLSGGQRKRVNVAMELIADPRLLFLDEPTSGLDPGLDLEMMSLLKQWAVGSATSDPKTIVLITHATENIRLCDHIVFMGLTRSGEDVRGGRVLYFGPPGESAETFFQETTFSAIYQQAQDSLKAAVFHARLTQESHWNRLLWERARAPEDIRAGLGLETSAAPSQTLDRPDFKKLHRQFKILTGRYFTLVRRDTGAFFFQLLQGLLVALLLWGVSAPDAFSVSGVRDAPTTLFVLSIAATWLGILNATKEIVKERRVYGRERRYGVRPAAYVLSKFAVLGGLGVWQMVGLIALTLYHFKPEEHIGAFGRLLPDRLQLIFPLEVEWFITLELMLLAGVALGLLISAIARSLDQATMIMFPAMLIQILLAGLLFDVGPFAWIAFTHWGLQALGNSLNLEALYAAAGKASDPILDTLNFASSGWALLGSWGVLALFSAALMALTSWRQSWADKVRIPED